jgi:hypothetical protein
VSAFCSAKNDGYQQRRRKETGIRTSSGARVADEDVAVLEATFEDFSGVRDGELHRAEMDGAVKRTGRADGGESERKMGKGRVEGGR